MLRTCLRFIWEIFPAIISTKSPTISIQPSMRWCLFQGEERGLSAEGMLSFFNARSYQNTFWCKEGYMTTIQTSCTIFRGTFIKLVLYFFQIDKNPTQKSSRNPWQTINFSAMLKARLVVPSGDLDKPLTLAMDCPWISGTYFWRVSWTL